MRLTPGECLHAARNRFDRERAAGLPVSEHEVWLDDLFERMVAVLRDGGEVPFEQWIAQWLQPE